MSTPNIYFAVQNEYNQAHYPDLIGRIYNYDIPIPPYLQLKNLPESIHKAFALIEKNHNSVSPTVNSQIQMTRIIIDEIGLPAHFIDLMYQHWSVTVIQYKPEAFYYKEWVIKKCLKTKL